MAAINANIRRYRITWNGIEGAPGLTTVYSYTDPAIDAMAYWKTFLEAIKSFFPAAVSLVYPASYDELDPTNGEYRSTTSITQQAGTSGLVSTQYAAPVGAVVHWNTSGHTAAIPPKHGSRRVTGSTYLVPLNQAQWQSDGTLVDATRTSIQSAATTMLGSFAGNMVIWTRPVWNASGAQVRTGVANPIFSATVQDKAAVLRSRRD